MGTLVYQIECPNKDYTEAVLERLKALGYGSLSYGASRFVFFRPGKCKEGLTTSSTNMVARGFSDMDNNYQSLTLDELFLKDFKPNMVKLNENYTAEVKEGKVIVGCQSFEKEKIKELYDLLYR